MPPGRLIPTKQLWGGNPVQFIKDLNVAETWANYSMSYVHHHLSCVHLNEFSPYNSAYLDMPTYQEDVEIDIMGPSVLSMSRNFDRYAIKLYA